MSTPALNGSTSRIGTPIRAITSTIANRAAPSIPPASQAYDPLLKALFRHRLRFVLLASGVVTWMNFTAWSYWQQGGLTKFGLVGALTLPISLWVLIATSLGWFAVALPITILRKTYLSSRRSNATSPFAIIKQALSQNSTKAGTIVYLVSAICSLVTHLIMVNAYELQIYGDPKLSFFVKSRKHPYYLNGRLLFLIVTQLSAALGFALRGAMTDRFAYKWADTGKSLASLFFVILFSFVISAVFTTLAIGFAAFVFAVLRLWLPFWFKIPFLHLLFRPFTAHFIKGPWTIMLPLRHFQLLFRAWFLAFGTFFVWETVDGLFDEAIVGTAPISSVTAEPNVTLVSGLSSEDKIFSFFAFSELRELASDTSASASARRTELFGDQKSALNLWAAVSRQSLLLLGRDYQTFLRRGQPEPVAPPPTPAEPKPIETPLLATPTPLLRQRVFKTAPESPGRAALDALASDGPIATAIGISADATHIPELFRSVVENRVVTPVAAETTKKVKNVAGLGSQWNNALPSLTNFGTKYTPGVLRKAISTSSRWLKRDRKNKVVESWLPFWEMDLVIIDALARLTSASLTEDRYGAVQRDIPKILEAMISFLTAIEEYQAELNASMEPVDPAVPSTENSELSVEALDTERAKEVLIDMGDGLKQGIQLIVNTFGDKLLAFKFPPRTAAKLQIFLDYITHE
ncbi:hypothetical protein BDN70DRAFT_802739 [Pholiota conissans]|uniref:Nucleoporin NDC1 n=1 Tax=Pholiota conissans TaxID=109636 RepID=A0A9P6D348_9AGAR|nr:hypothetical protein BDN70DRAFT_802739 [Pholiota conissans]